MNSIIKILNRTLKALAISAFWLLVWELISLSIDAQIIVPSPLSVGKRLIELASSSIYWKTVLHSIVRILLGFILAVLSGSVIAVITSRVRFFDALFSPLLSVVRATPVASFIILALIWLDKQLIPGFIAFLMVFPIIHGNVSAGIKNIDRELLEMAKVFHIKKRHIIFKLAIPSVVPYFSAGSKTALGLAWKSGVAAEVLCTPLFSIGKMLYESKIYIETTDVFAWTVTIIIISIIIEKVIMWAIEKAVPTDLTKEGKV